MSNFIESSILTDNYFESEEEDIEKLNAILKAETSTESDSNEIASNSDEKEIEKICLKNEESDILNINFTFDSSYKDQVDSYISKINTINVNKVLLLNKSQQMLLIEGIKRYQEILDECNRQIESVGYIIRKHLKQTKYKLSTFFKCVIPFFKTKNGSVCPPNSDAIKKKLNGEISQVDLPLLKFWLSDERKVLWESVLEQSIKMKLQSTKNGLSNAQNKNADHFYPVTARNIPIDWLKISTQDLKGRHSDEECKSMWFDVMHPHLNDTPFGPKETEQLKKIVDKYNNQNWDQIAKDLGTNRSGYKCFIYFQVHNTQNKESRKWTPEDDKQLLHVIESCRIGSFIPWGKVSYYIKNRTKEQLYCRYTNSICGKVKKGKFSLEEDLIIVALVQKLGKKFSKIATYLPGRTPPQIRIRYNHFLITALSNDTYGKWTIEEDEKIIKFVKQYGTKNWSCLAKEFQDNYNRSRINLRHRWSVIKKYINVETFEGDLNKIPRLKPRSKQNKIPSILLKRMANKLESLEEINHNPKILFKIAKAVQRNIIDYDDIVTGFNKYFISSFYSLKPLNEYNELHLINSLFILTLLEAQINVDFLKNIQLKYLEKFDCDLNRDLKRIIDLMEMNTDKKLINFFYSYWQKYYNFSILILYDQIPFPKELATTKEFGRTLIILKYILKYVLWTESNLDRFYVRKDSKYICSPELHDSSYMDKLVKETEEHINNICFTKQCQEFFVYNVDKDLSAPASKTTFKLRLLALFSLPILRKYTEKIVLYHADIESLLIDEEQKRLDKCEIQVKKRGRPKKKLRGGYLKHSEDDNCLGNYEKIKINDNSSQEQIVEIKKKLEDNANKPIEKVGEPPRKKVKLSHPIRRTNPSRSCRKNIVEILKTKTKQKSK